VNDIAATGAGTVESVWLLVERTSTPASGPSRILVLGRCGTRLPILFTAGSPGEAVDWEPDRWYQVRNLVHTPDLSTRSRTCSQCGGELEAESESVQCALDMTAGLADGEQFVGTQRIEVTARGQTEWVGPKENVAVDPITWYCPGCDTTLTDAAGAAHTASTPPRENLADRLNSALSGAPTAQPTHTWHSGNSRPGSGSFRSQLSEGHRPSGEAVPFGQIRAPYADSSTVRDTTLVSSLSPTLEAAVSPDPVTDTMERFCELTLNTRSFDWARYRPPMDLVLAIDISGSMATVFDSDSSDNTAPTAGSSKLTAVRETLATVLQRLLPTDRLGVVLFDSAARVVRPLGPVAESTYREFRTRLSEVTPAGDTDPSCGLERAGELFERAPEPWDSDTERRILFLSDTLPTSDTGSMPDCDGSPQRAVRTTYVGLAGARHETARALCQTPGANVAGVEDASQLASLLRRHVDSLLFPVAFDLRIEPAGETAIQALPRAADPASGDSVFARRTVFPAGPTAQSLSNVLVQLSDSADTATFDLSWTDRDGEPQRRRVSTDRLDQSSEWYESDAIQQSVALARFQRALRAVCVADAGPDRRSDAVATPNPDARVSSLLNQLRRQQAALGTEQLETDIELLTSVLAD